MKNNQNSERSPMNGDQEHLLGRGQDGVWRSSPWCLKNGLDNHEDPFPCTRETGLPLVKKRNSKCQGEMCRHSSVVSLSTGITGSDGILGLG